MAVFVLPTTVATRYISHTNRPLIVTRYEWIWHGGVLNDAAASRHGVAFSNLRFVGF